MKRQKQIKKREIKSPIVRQMLESYRDKKKAELSTMEIIKGMRQVVGEIKKCQVSNEDYRKLYTAVMAMFLMPIPDESKFDIMIEALELVQKTESPNIKQEIKIEEAPRYIG